jgi:hypothetical protein
VSKLLTDLVGKVPDLAEKNFLAEATGGLISGSITKILREKLGKRNTAAHPSSVVVVQAQADDVVTDVVNNVVIALT